MKCHQDRSADRDHPRNNCLHGKKILYAVAFLILFSQDKDGKKIQQGNVLLLTVIINGRYTFWFLLPPPARKLAGFLIARACRIYPYHQTWAQVLLIFLYLDFNLGGGRGSHYVSILFSQSHAVWM